MDVIVEDLICIPTDASSKKNTLYRPVHPRGGEVSKKEWGMIKKRVDSFFKKVTGKARDDLNRLVQKENEELLREFKSCRNKSRLKKVAGYVYLIKSKDDLFKIGISKSPDSRIKFLGVKLPFIIETIHRFRCDNSPKAEYKLHEHFRKNGKWVDGEWFRLSKIDVKKICSINAYLNNQFLDKKGRKINDYKI